LGEAAIQLLGHAAALVGVLGGNTVADGLHALREEGHRPGAAAERRWRALDAAASFLRHPLRARAVVLEAAAFARACREKVDAATGTAAGEKTGAVNDASRKATTESPSGGKAAAEKATADKAATEDAAGEASAEIFAVTQLLESASSTLAAAPLAAAPTPANEEESKPEGLTLALPAAAPVATRPSPDKEEENKPAKKKRKAKKRLAGPDDLLLEEAAQEARSATLTVDDLIAQRETGPCRHKLKLGVSRQCCDAACTSGVAGSPAPSAVICISGLCQFGICSSCFTRPD